MNPDPINQTPPLIHESVIADPEAAAPATEAPAPLTSAEINASSLLDELKADIAAEDQEVETISYPIPERPGFTATFRRHLVHDFVVEQTKRAVDTEKNTIDELSFSARLLLEYNVSFQRNGVVFRDEDGRPLTYKSAGFREATGTLTPVASIKKFYKVDSDVINMANELRRASGYDRRIEAVDPFS